MGQHLKDSHRIAISIFDYGRGILKSFKDSNYHNMPRTAKDAITLALQEKVTRDPNVGQGNGMWGLSELVLNNGGLLRIISSEAGIQFNSGDVSDILKHLVDIKGEIVVVVSGAKKEENCDNLTISEHIELYIDMGNSVMDSIKMVAKERNVSKSVIYNEYHNLKK